jgi:hypothetical protein
LEASTSHLCRQGWIALCPSPSARPASTSFVSFVLSFVPLFVCFFRLFIRLFVFPSLDDKVKRARSSDGVCDRTDVEAKKESSVVDVALQPKKRNVIIKQIVWADSNTRFCEKIKVFSGTDFYCFLFNVIEKFRRILIHPGKHLLKQRDSFEQSSTWTEQPKVIKLRKNRTAFWFDQNRWVFSNHFSWKETYEWIMKDGIFRKR